MTSQDMSVEVSEERCVTRSVALRAWSHNITRYIPKMCLTKSQMSRSDRLFASQVKAVEAAQICWHVKITLRYASSFLHSIWKKEFAICLISKNRIYAQNGSIGGSKRNTAVYEYQNPILGFNKETSVVSGRDLPLMVTRRISIFTTFQQFQNSQGQILPASDSRNFLYHIRGVAKKRIFYSQAGHK